MRDLGDVLELLHTSPDRWESLRLFGTHWINVPGYREAWERWTAVTQLGSTRVSVARLTAVGGSPRKPEPDEVTAQWRLWHAKPNKIRTEFDVGLETVRAVLIGPEWWSWSRSAGFRTNHGDPSSTHGVGPGEVLVDTPPLLSALRLRGVNRTTFKSRSAYTVSAEPAGRDRNGPASVLHHLGLGADMYQFVVDAETGILLRNQAEWQRQPFQILEVEDLGLDEALNEDLFTSRSLAG